MNLRTTIRLGYLLLLLQVAVPAFADNPAPESTNLTSADSDTASAPASAPAASSPAPSTPATQPDSDPLVACKKPWLFGEYETTCRQSELDAAKLEEEWNDYDMAGWPGFGN